MPKFNPKDFQSDKPKIKYGCAKLAITLSEKKPKMIYPHLDLFIKLLDGENRILKWTAIRVIGNLSQADAKGKINQLMPRLIQFVHDQEMITAANAIKALGVIAHNKPRLKQKIFNEFLKVGKNNYYLKGQLSPECRNVALGHVINVFSEYKDELKEQKSIVRFLKRQTGNTRPTVRKRAKELLSQIEK